MVKVMNAQSAEEQPNPYGGQSSNPGSQQREVGGASAGSASPADGGEQPAQPRRRTRIVHLQRMKDAGQKWAMLTSYDQFTASIFDEAGIPALLVGDSAGNNVYGYSTTLPVTLDQMIPLTRAVVEAAPHTLVVADLPFGSYGASPEQGFHSAVRLMKEGLAHAVKLEGGVQMAPTVKLLTDAGIPVMAHLGFTPQSEHGLGGYRVQGRGDAAVQKLVDDALALQGAGAFAVVLEMVPVAAARAVTEALRIPTVGIGAGPDCDAQVLVWTDFAGMGSGRTPRFTKKYADARSLLREAAVEYASEVADGVFPSEEHSFLE